MFAFMYMRLYAIAFSNMIVTIFPLFLFVSTTSCSFPLFISQTTWFFFLLSLLCVGYTPLYCYFLFVFCCCGVGTVQVVVLVGNFTQFYVYTLFTPLLRFVALYIFIYYQIRYFLLLLQQSLFGNSREEGGDRK